MASREQEVLRGTATGAGAILGGPVGAALIGGGLTLAQNIWSAKRADSAHQREVRDLRRAGLNPILAARSSGAEVGAQESVVQGASSALAVRRANAEIALLEAQARREHSASALSDMQRWEIGSFAHTRGAQALSAADASDAAAQFSRLQTSQQRELFAEILAKARAEVGLVTSSARAQEARALLDELDADRMRVSSEFFKDYQEMFERLGPAGPWLRALGVILMQMRR